MKKLLALLTLTFCLSLVSHAEPYFPGAWYSTKQLGAIRQAGAVEARFYAAHSMQFDIYLGGGFLETVNATYSETTTLYKFSFVDSYGWTWRGTMNKRTGFLSGSFYSATRRTSGKFQAARDDDGE